MKAYQVKLELLSPTLIGSGEGFGLLIDTDIVFDDAGIPFIPSKRIKGCLLDSVKEVKELFDSSHIDYSINIETAFGKTGSSESGAVYFSNLTIEDYDINKAWLDYYLKNNKYPDLLSKERILETFTEIRQQTAIDNGVAKDGALRTIRVIKKGFKFYGDVHIDNETEAIVNTLALACLNFRFIGTKRNRGFGEVHCSLLKDGNELPIKKKLEELCTA
jgi:CRISPR-associated protein Csx10